MAGAIRPVAGTSGSVAGTIGPVAGAILNGPVAGTSGSVAGTIGPVAGAILNGPVAGVKLIGSVAGTAGSVVGTIVPVAGTIGLAEVLATTVCMSGTTVGKVRSVVRYPYMLHQCRGGALTTLTKWALSMQPMGLIVHYVRTIMTR